MYVVIRAQAYEQRFRFRFPEEVEIFLLAIVRVFWRGSATDH